MTNPRWTDEQFADRFWNRVDQSNGPDACWPWRRPTHAGGYGDVHKAGRRILAHRMAYMLTKGQIPVGHEVLHTCDNPPCCNPAHLWTGTHLDNMRDREAKGRNVNHRGEAHGMAKLTEDDVRAIRAEYRPPEFPPVGSKPWLAAKYGVSVGTIANVLAGKVWKHVE